MIKMNNRRLVSVGLVLVLGVVFSVTNEFFLTSRNIFLLLRDCANIGLVTLGVVCVMVSGGVDLSAGGIICLVGVVTARVSLIPGIPGIVVVLIAVAAGAVCGFINSMIILKLHLSEFVTTLATGLVFTGLALLTTFRENGRLATVLLTNRSFLTFGTRFNEIYYVSIAWLVLTVIMQFMFTKTRLGLYISALGSNPKAARMSAIGYDRVKITGFVLCGAFSALSAAFMVAFQSSTTQLLGVGMEFQAIAACVVGGVVLGGGKGDALSAFLGTIFLIMIRNGLYKWGLSHGGFTMLQGVLIILIANFDTLFGTLVKKRSLRRAAEREVKDIEQQ